MDTLIGNIGIGVLLIVCGLMLGRIANLEQKKYSGDRIAACKAAAEYLNFEQKREVHNWYMKNCTQFETG